MQIFWCLKFLKYYNKKRQITRPFLLFLVPYISFLFESLKLIRQFFPRLEQISGCSKLLKSLNIFQNFLSSSKFFCSTPMFLIFLPCTRKVFFLEQNQFLQLFKLVEILHQNFNFDFACSIIVPQWRRKKLLFI